MSRGTRRVTGYVYTRENLRWECFWGSRNAVFVYTLSLKVGACIHFGGFRAFKSARGQQWTVYTCFVHPAGIGFVEAHPLVDAEGD